MSAEILADLEAAATAYREYMEWAHDCDDDDLENLDEHLYALVEVLGGVVTKAAANLKPESNVLYAVYFASGDYDSALIYRDGDEAERVAEAWCKERGEGFAWTDWVTVR